VEQQMLVFAGVLAMSLLLSMGLSSLLNSIVTKPIAKLVRTARQITEDTPGIRAEVDSTDELGLFARAFNQMLDAIEQRDTELKRQKAEVEQLNLRLQASNKELDQFAHVASHDLQEPLRKIQTFGDGLKRKSSGMLDVSSREYLEHMLDCAGRMRELIQDLLELSRVVSKGAEFAPVNLDDVAARVLSDLAVTIRESAAEIRISPLGTIDADRSQMYRLLQNLISNSLKYRRAGIPPVITVDAEEGFSEQLATAVIRLTVRDNGIGFESQYSERIFRPFQRLHGRDEYSGTGMGLAICARIVERHHGLISCKGRSEEGAEFVTTLPVKQQPGGQADAQYRADSIAR
jgi:light-regulated signal transduction histidine kinase (bacteriophytochrome)/HAMP domain-containing protein